MDSERYSAGADLPAAYRFGCAPAFLRAAFYGAK
jgi:hypothetical protein